MDTHDLLAELRARFGVEPSAGLQILAADLIVRQPFDPGMALLVLPARGHSEALASDTDFDAAVLPGRAVHGAASGSMLRALYPGDHPVYGMAGAADSTIAEVTEAELDSGVHFVPQVQRLSNIASPHALPWLVARLRAPGGCPWDREQDHLSLRKFLLEESYEVYDALEKGSTPALAEELGDLLLQIVLHAQYSAEAGVFDLTDVYRNVMTKIVRRHPHVFGDVVAASAAEVIRNWEQIKAGERAGRQTTGSAAVPAAFAGLSRSLPALAYAQEMQERAAALGYDWPTIEGVLEKVTEEAAEVIAADDESHRSEEFGDLLMVLVNLARKTGIDAEAALRAASAKFATRFAHVERLAAERDVELRSLNMGELDELWQAAKRDTAPAGARR